MGKNNQQVLHDNPPNSWSHFHGNPDQHCPFVLKPPLIADVSEFRLFPQQQQVTRAIFKLFEFDKKIAKIISIPRAVFIFDMHQREGGIPGIPTTEYCTRQYHHDLIYAVGQTISSDKPISDKQYLTNLICVTQLLYV